MRVRVDREELEEALKKAKESTEKKAALPILANFLLEAADERLTVKATDLENFLLVSVKAEVYEEGKACVPSQKLYEIVRNLSSAYVELSVEGERLTVVGGRSTYRLPLAPPEDFPEFPEFPEGGEQLPGSTLLTGIEKVEYAVAKEDANVALQGMLLRGYEERIHFVGSDGHRLALYEPPGSLSLELLLPRKSLKVLRRLISGIEEVLLSADAEGAFAFFSAEEWKLAVRLLEGEYPDYLSVIPEEFSAQVLVETEELLRALKRLKSLSEGSVFPVKLVLTDNALVLEFSDPELGEAREELEVEYAGEPFEIGFNGKYLMEALDAFDSERVWLKFTTPDTAALLEAEDYERDPYKCIIMPMRV
ncbi:MAG: DNA polymerase III subunit beta [Aquificae bacterium]|nr:DNA polymerase III subunit beta [Aquificota bacterium]